VREALTNHLFATRNGLEEVLAHVADPAMDAIVSGEVVEPEPAPAPEKKRLARPKGGKASA